MFVLDRECLEAALPDVSATAVMSVVPTDVTDQEPLHEPAQVAVLMRPKHQVKWFFCPAQSWRSVLIYLFYRRTRFVKDCCDGCPDIATAFVHFNV
jgi:hypothetical protein